MTSVPIGSELLVNSPNIAREQGNPAIAMDGFGNYAIVWQSEQPDATRDIYGQRYDSGGNLLGSAFQINSYTPSNQTKPALAMDYSGNFVVAWQSTAQDGSSEGIYAQRYDSSGNPAGGEFRINTSIADDQTNPAVAMDASGNFVVIWQSNNQDTSGLGIYAQRYDSSGAPQGGEFLVNATSSDDQANPAVAMDGSGNFVVVWQSNNQDGSGLGIYARRYDSSGAPQGGEFPVNTYSADNQYNPTVAMDDSGGFVIAWESLNQGGFASGVYAQQYDSSGVVVGGEFRANTGSDRASPAVAIARSGGKFAIASTGSDGDGQGIYGQGFGPTPTVQFSQAIYQYSEDNTPIGVAATLIRTGDPDVINGVTSQVELSFADGTADTNDYDIASYIITFNPGETSQVVYLPIIPDNIHEPTEEFYAQISPISNADIGTPSPATIQLLDNDPASVAITQTGSSTDVTEGGATDTYTVVLTSQPTAPVTVTITPDAQTNLGAGAGVAVALNFDPSLGSWDVLQTITVQAVDDTVIENNHTSIIAHSVTSADADYNGSGVAIAVDGVAAPNVIANITDNDAPGVSITQSGGSTDVVEGGGSPDTYTVVLTTPPTADVTISFNTDSQLQAIAPIIFTPANWNVAQTVTVQATDDAVAEGSHTSTITHTASSADSGYNGIAINNVIANITDNDTPSVAIAPTSTNATEGGVPGSFTVQLATLPTAPVTINFATDSQIQAISPITFDNTNWDIAQTITVTAVDDAVVEGIHGSTITPSIAPSSAAEYLSVSPSSVAVSIADNDSPAVSISQTSVSVTEGGTVGTYTVQLTTAPSAPVTINFSTDSQISPIAPVTFDSTTWNVPQTVTVAAVDDAFPEGIHNSTITHSIAPGSAAEYLPVLISEVAASITDNDTPAVSIALTAATAAEGGAPGSYTVVLTAAPTADVTINFTTDTQVQAIAPITFTPANWNVPQTVTVTATDDAIAEGLHNSTIGHSAASTDANYNGIVISDATIAIADNDTAGVSITPTSTTATEGGATGSYKVVLTSQPTAPVAISFDTGNQINPIAAIAFDSTNWNVAQTVTVTATDDAIPEGLHAGTINHAASSADVKYNGIAIASLTAQITDNDSPGVSIVQSSGSTDIAEGGASDTYSLVLTTQPAADVTVNFNTGNQINPIAPITFTAANWNVPQTVTVTATDDAAVEGNHIGTISHAAVSGDANYNGVAIASISAGITDNDTPGVTVQPVNADVTEGGAIATYNLVLNTAPTADVAINFNGGSQINAISPIAFTPANWNVAQTVTVIATDDAAIEGLHGGTITHTATSADANYNGIAIVPVTAAIADNDSAGVSIIQSGGSTNVTEGGAIDTYDIVLTKPPTAPVTVSFATGSQINPIAAITFDSNNWNVPQTVTVSAVDDLAVEGNHSGAIAHSATSADASYNGLAIASVNASITDNDSAGVSISPTSTSAAEGGAPGSYTVVLTKIPTAPVTINFTTDSQVQAIAPIVFDSTNWNVPQTVTVTAEDDAVVEGNHNSTIVHSAVSADANYNNIGINSTVVAIADNDTAPPPGTRGVTLIQPVGSTDVLESYGTDIYKVVLDSQPTADVTVAISTDGQTTTDKQALVFTPDNWNVAQTVTVQATDDAAVEGAGTSAISHAVTSADANYNGIAIGGILANVSDNETAGDRETLLQKSTRGFTDRDDFITGSAERDRLFGRAGNDYLDGGSGDDILYGQEGDDGIAGGDGNDILQGGKGNDHFNGNLGNDIAFGGQGSDRLRGGSGSDKLYGDFGNDHLFGDIGADTLTGGAGSDAFAIGAGTGGAAVETADFIADFTFNEDKIDLIGSLTFAQLNIFQGTGENASNAILQDSATGEYLAILQGISASSLNAANFL